MKRNVAEIIGTEWAMRVARAAEAIAQHHGGDKADEWTWAVVTGLHRGTHRLIFHSPSKFLLLQRIPT